MVTPRSTAGPFIAITVLAALLLAAGAFVVALVLRPTAATTAASATVVTARVATPCASPKHDTACFDSTITNAGTEASAFACRVTASGETAAAFADGSPNVELNLGPGGAAHVSAVVTVRGNTEAVAPSVSCTPVQT